MRVQVSLDSAETEVHSNFCCLATHCSSSGDPAITDVTSVPPPTLSAAFCTCLHWDVPTRGWVRSSDVIHAFPGALLP